MSMFNGEPSILVVITVLAIPVALVLGIALIKYKNRRR